MAKKGNFVMGDIPQGNGNYLTGKMPRKNGGIKTSFGGDVTKEVLKGGKKIGKMPGFGGNIPGGKQYAKDAAQYTGSQKCLKKVLFKGY